MKQIIIIKDLFENCENLENFFKRKNIKCSLLTSSELNNLDLPKSILIGSKNFENTIEGKNNLIKISRKIGCSKIILIDNNSQKYKVNSDLGGAYSTYSFTQFDEAIYEIILNAVSDEKFSFSDPKTQALINLAKRVADTDVTVFVHGPTGTGKEVISNFIHKESKRKK